MYSLDKKTLRYASLSIAYWLSNILPGSSKATDEGQWVKTAKRFCNRVGKFACRFSITSSYDLLATAALAGC
jgi:hypothetical protein